MSKKPQADSQEQQASMPSLDDKLSIILRNMAAYDLETNLPAHVEAANIKEIHRAFQDANYFQLTETDIARATAKVLDGRMTGQEFYDRFLKELPSMGHSDEDKWKAYGFTIRDAARRAAGIGEGEPE